MGKKVKGTKKHRRRRRVDYGRFMVVCAAVVCTALLVVYTVILFRPKDDHAASQERNFEVEMVDVQTLIEESVDLNKRTPAPSVEPMPTQSVNAQGFLPILHRKSDEADAVVITVDDCFRSEHVKTILEMAKEYDIKLTFFPIGRIIKNDPDIWTRVLDEGHEIENHTYQHTDLEKLTQEEIETEITRMSDNMNKALGANYAMHFIRPPGGSGRKEQKVHAAAIKLGYYGIAHWEVSDSRGAQWIIENTKPGSILLFHATQEDIEMLRQVIPAFQQKGFRMITMNEMYDLPANAMQSLSSQK